MNLVDVNYAPCILCIFRLLFTEAVDLTKTKTTFWLNQENGHENVLVSFGQSEGTETTKKKRIKPTKKVTFGWKQQIRREQNQQKRCYFFQCTLSLSN